MLDKLKGWWASPYKDGMTVIQWWLFIGLMIAIVVSWRLILKEVLEND